ncbi:helix-turn-helix domain-containing protein [Umezawaea sp. Da 62-37]|uniref:helix-turn-helix domain-containing protein n=1 Tax=Umezawaea sp. Da 62-37 TaxID=3075927 RepID=UPI0028F6E85D|nr:LuxR C-terminal-related transcriptional regulator [Umezawaea sp. Da 62-37]WNV89554.1 LuxR C-terminal-related transcriptional regulator [Umezawaea sp. Da 62-37]
MLGALGLDPAEERVYRAVVSGYRGDADVIAASVGIGRTEAVSTLSALLAKGLVTRTGRWYTAAPPDVLLGPMLVKGQAELERARAAVSQLADEYRGGARRRDSARLVDVVTGAEAIRHRLLSMQREAREEVVWFCRKAPIAMTSPENDEEAAALARGVRYRAVFETALLEEPGELAEVVDSIRAGLVGRSLPTLPVRLAIADRSIALCPLVTDDATGEPTAALVMQSSLLSALVALFESYWERAIPLRIGDDAGGADVPLTPDERQLLSLLLAGISDKAIATQLRVSQRTVQRRLQELMQRADAQSRMHLAWRINELGWLADDAGWLAPG